MKVRVVSEKAIELPAIKLDEAMRKEIAETIRDGIIDGILRQRQADGTPLKENAPSTRERKRREGKPALSLIDKLRRFIRKDTWELDYSNTKFVAIEPNSTDDFATIAEDLQYRGYTGWFGVTPKAAKACKKLVKEWLEKIFKEAARKSQR